MVGEVGKGLDFEVDLQAIAPDDLIIDPGALWWDPDHLPVVRSQNDVIIGRVTSLELRGDRLIGKVTLDHRYVPTIPLETGMGYTIDEMKPAVVTKAKVTTVLVRASHK